VTIRRAEDKVADPPEAASEPQPAPDGEGRGFVSLNGTLVGSETAAVSVFDHGLLYGDGVFDTMFASHGMIFRLGDHLARFRRSLRAIRLTLPIPEQRLESEILRTVAANGLRDAYIKVVATRGVSLEPLLDPRDCSPTLIVFARPYLWLADPSKREQGISAKVTAIRRIGLPALDPRIKSLDYLNLVLAKLEAIAAGADEALLLDGEGLVCEAPGYNVFVVRAGRVLTPDRSILEGVTRATVLELCQTLSIPAYDLLTADEVFLTSTAGGLVPVVRVDGAKIGDGKRGPVLRRIDAAYRDLQRSGRYGTPIPGLATAGVG
jgi:branched-chain amino acid aminotransferase